jgi:heme A synthase
MEDIPARRRMSAYARAAWGLLAYNLGVVLWGAYVRATGSGAGCGSHWPLCDGQVVPRSPGQETLIEFTHRLSSGLALILVFGLFLWARGHWQAGDSRRWAAGAALFFTVTEALVGAGLVLLGYVADDSSVERAAVVSIHLVNTFLLLAALAVNAWWASGGGRLPRRASQGHWAWIGVGVLAMLLIGVSGAVTALGDTLFPAPSLREGLAHDLSPTAHLFIRLRIFHPLISALCGAYLLVASRKLFSAAPSRTSQVLMWAVSGLIIVQMLVGLTNLVLLAPIPLQLVHLLLADLVWIAFVLLSATVSGGHEFSQVEGVQGEQPA